MDKMGQVDYEEAVASLIFDYEYTDPEDRPPEEACTELGRKIIKVLGLVNILQLGVNDE